MPTVRFFDRHIGIRGALVPLPRRAAEIAARWDGRDGDPADVVAELEAAFPGAAVKDTPPGPDPFGVGRPDGFIGLEIPAEGFPRHAWRFIQYVPIAGPNP